MSQPSDQEESQVIIKNLQQSLSLAEGKAGTEHQMDPNGSEWSNKKEDM